MYSVGRVFAYFYTLDDDSKRPMDYETSLLPKVFSFIFEYLLFVPLSKIATTLNNTCLNLGQKYKCVPLPLQIIPAPS